MADEQRANDPVITFRGVVGVTFVDDQADMRVGDSVEIFGLTKNTEMNGVQGQVKEVKEDGPEPLYKVVMRGEKVAVLKNANLRRGVGVSIVKPAEGDAIDLGKELQLKVACSKASDLDPVREAMARLLEDEGARANIAGEWVVKEIEWDEQPLQSKSSFKWIEEGSMLKFHGAVDTTVIPRQAPPQPGSSACCTVQ